MLRGIYLNLFMYRKSHYISIYKQNPPKFMPTDSFIPDNSTQDA